MTNIKKISTALALVTIVIIGIAATKPPEEHKFKNLKVLPKDISDEDLDKVMDNFKAALGVKCNFCHAPSKDTTNHHPDFASDDKPEKDIARHMMRMTAKINKKYFSFNKDEKGETQPAISCMTCHRGNPHPEVKN
ncbi:MAG TPA: c-type cytochrome [Puia sp.]|nr:c-type cytochrome [Puia sp.]